MKKQTDTLKLTLLAAFVAVLSVGCASTGYARYDADQDNDATGVSAGAEVGTDTGVRASARLDDDEDDDMEDNDARMAKGSARSSVTALSFVPITYTTETIKWPFYDSGKTFRAIEVYTFAVPDPNVTLTAEADAPAFSADLEPGSVFVEAAGGSGEVRAGRVIQHSPTPTN